MILKDKNRNKTIQLLESLLIEKDNLYKGNAFGFASKTLELIKKAKGKESEQFRLMSNLLYDQSALMNLERTIYPADSLIVHRVKTDEKFDYIITSCIEEVKSFGLYKPINEKKNIFGDLDNSMLWTIMSGIAILSFTMGVFYSKLDVEKLLNSNNEYRNNHNIKDTINRASLKKYNLIDSTKSK